MKSNNLILIGLIALASAGGGYGIAKFSGGSSSQVSATATEKKPLFYRSPMNPSVTSKVPATDAMGMDYVPVYAEDAGDQNDVRGTVRIDPVTTQDIGVRTARVVMGRLASNIQAVGRVTFNEETMTKMHTKTKGWISKLWVSKTGAWVKKGDILLSIYSPQLVTSQQEYLLAIKNLKNVKKLKGTQFDELYQNGREMVSTSRERLTLLDVPEHQIKELEKSLKIKENLHIHSISTGAVIHINAREGQYVTPKDEIFMIADLSKVWVLAEIYENELPWVAEGNLVELRLAGLPGRVFHGKLVYIYPYAQARTRTIQVRMEFDNADMALKPEMFANVTIASGKQVDALLVPSQAIVRTGVREQVFVVRAPGKFEPRPVTIGLSAEGKTQVLSGLKEGEVVVTSSTFLIDSESKLREATAKMQDKGEGKPSSGGKMKMDMPGMKMDGKMKMDMSNMKGGQS